MEYLVFYLLIIFGVVASKRWGGDFSYFILCVLIVSFSTFRYETGFDWPVYDNYLSNKFNNVYFPVFELFKYIYNLFELDKVYFYSFVSILGNVLILVAASRYFRDYRYFFILFYVFWTDFYLIHSFSIIRQFICLAFLLFAFSNKINGRRYKIYILLALLTHHAAILYFVFLFFFSWLKSLNYRNVWFAFFVFSTCFFFDLSIVSVILKNSLSFFNIPYLEMYFLNDTFNTSIYLKFVIVLSLGFVLFCSIETSKRVGITKNEYYFCTIYVFIMLVFYAMPTITTRLSLFFVFPVIKVVAIYLQRVVPVQRLMIKFGLLIVFSFSVFRFYSSPLNVTYFPYQTWLIESDVKNSTGLKRTQDVYDQLNKLGVF